MLINRGKAANQQDRQKQFQLRAKKPENARCQHDESDGCAESIVANERYDSPQSRHRRAPFKVEGATPSVPAIMKVGAPRIPIIQAKKPSR
jgi:hypothetical protein